MESKETRKLLFFKHNGSTNFSLIFLIEKRESLVFKRLKFASSTTGPSATGCETSRSEMGVWPVSLSSTTEHP